MFPHTAVDLKDHKKLSWRHDCQRCCVQSLISIFPSQKCLSRVIIRLHFHLWSQKSFTVGATASGLTEDHLLYMDSIALKPFCFFGQIPCWRGTDGCFLECLAFMAFPPHLSFTLALCSLLREYYVVAWWIRVKHFAAEYIQLMSLRLPKADGNICLTQQ